jgi:hypothetical protein
MLQLRVAARRGQRSRALPGLPSPAPRAFPPTCYASQGWSQGGEPVFGSSDPFGPLGASQGGTTMWLCPALEPRGC